MAVIQEDLIYRYLLGDLPESEQLALEQEAFDDGEIFERVWEIENDLVDRYVRGKLTAAEKGLFEENYLASPVHLKRVAFARSLVEAVDSGKLERKGSIRSAPSVSRWSSFLSSISGKSWRLATIATILILAVASGWLLGERAHLHKRIGQITDESASERQRVKELEREMASEREQSDKLAAEIERLHAELGNTGGPSPTLPVQNEPRSVISFLLSPMLIRSNGETQKLKISKETEVVLLQMNVKEPGARVFQVDLRTVEGAQVWSKGDIKARPQTRTGSVVSISIPASKLAGGDYILTLSATDAANDTEAMNRYFIRVVRD
jgi:hypothetical protein